MSLLLDILIIRELGIGGARVRVKPFRWVRFCRATRLLFEIRSPRGHFPPNDLNLVKNEQIGAVELKDRTMSRIWVQHDVEMWKTEESTVAPNLIPHEHLCCL